MKRSLTLTLTVQVQADMDVESPDTLVVRLTDVRHAVIGSVNCEDPQDQLINDENVRKTAATEATKMAVRFLNDRFTGEHAAPPPEVNQRGALA